jgi:hypothetical protein
MYKPTAQPIGVQPISDHGGNKQCKYFEAELKRYVGKSLGVKDGIELVWFTWIGPVFCLRLVETKEVVGYMNLDACDPDWGLRFKYYQSGVFIRKEYRGRKLGTVLYLGALHVFRHLVSDPHIGIDAIHTWASLSKYGYHVKLWSIESHMNIEFDFTPEGPKTAAGLMTNLEDTFLLYV